MSIDFIELTEITKDITKGESEIAGKITIPINLIGKVSENKDLHPPKDFPSKKDSNTTSTLLLNYATQMMRITVAENYKDILRSINRNHALWTI